VEAVKAKAEAKAEVRARGGIQMGGILMVVILMVVVRGSLRWQYPSMVDTLK